MAQTLKQCMFPQPWILHIFIRVCVYGADPFAKMGQIVPLADKPIILGQVMAELGFDTVV